jgi:hypothetical protein
MHWDSSAQIVTWRKINMTQSCSLVMQRVVWVELIWMKFLFLSLGIEWKSSRILANRRMNPLLVLSCECQCNIQSYQTSLRRGSGDRSSLYEYSKEET